MVTKEISVKKYVVRLNADEREQLEALIRKGKSPAQRLLKARILLKADVSQAGEGWSDSRIIKALETSPSMVYRTRKQLVEAGFEAVLSRTGRRILDAEAEHYNTGARLRHEVADAVAAGYGRHGRGDGAAECVCARCCGALAEATSRDVPALRYAEGT